MTTQYEKVEQEIETEMKDMDIGEHSYPERSGYLKVSLIEEIRLNTLSQDRLTRQIETLEKALDHIKDNHDVIFHNMRHGSFCEGLVMGLEYSKDILEWNESELSIEELTE